MDSRAPSTRGRPWSYRRHHEWIWSYGRLPITTPHFPDEIRCRLKSITFACLDAAAKWVISPLMCAEVGPWAVNMISLTPGASRNWVTYSGVITRRGRVMFGVAASSQIYTLPNVLIPGIHHSYKWRRHGIDKLLGGFLMKPRPTAHRPPFPCGQFFFMIAPPFNNSIDGVPKILTTPSPQRFQQHLCYGYQTRRHILLKTIWYNSVSFT